MAVILKNSDGVKLPHEAMVRLRNSGALNLGIRDDLARRIAEIKDFGPKKTPAVAAFRFWNLVASGVFFYTVYLSFTSSWWWFIVGLFGAGLIVNANKTGNSQNFLDAAMIDKEFYHRVLEIDGWMYQVKDEDAVSVKNQSTRWKIISDCGEFFEHDNSVFEIRDVQDLPHPKEEILSAIYLELPLVDDEHLRNCLKGGAIFLANYQIGVGKEPLSMMGVSIEELLKFPRSDDEQLELAKKMANNPESERYEHFRALVDAELATISAKLAEAESLRK